MSLQNKTMLSGIKDGRHKTYFLSGHWKIESAIKTGRRWGLTMKIIIKHLVWDNSGHGRGGHDGLWEVDENNNAVKVEDWQEGGRHKKA